MILLDTDTFSLLTRGSHKVATRMASATDVVAITIVTCVEALQGRFAYLLRAVDGPDLLRAQSYLQRTQADLDLQSVIPFDQAGSAEFDRLIGTKGLKKVGRADLLIASIALANKATLVTRNLKDFQKIPGLRIENWAD